MYIVKAAVMYSDGEIVHGYDYSEIVLLATKLGFSGDKIEGFITSTDEFILPADATEIAINAGQISSISGALTPDMLWPEGVITG